MVLNWKLLKYFYKTKIKKIHVIETLQTSIEKKWLHTYK